MSASDSINTPCIACSMSDGRGAARRGADRSGTCTWKPRDS